MKTKIGNHVVIFEFLRRGTNGPDEIVTDDGVVYSRTHLVTKKGPDGKPALVFDQDGKPKVSRNRGRIVGVIMAIDNMKLGWSVLDDEDYFSTFPYGRLFNRTFALAGAFAMAFKSDEFKAAHPIPTRFRYDYLCMMDRAFRYFQSENGDLASKKYLDLMSGEVFDEK